MYLLDQGTALKPQAQKEERSAQREACEQKGVSEQGQAREASRTSDWSRDVTVHSGHNSG